MKVGLLLFEEIELQIEIAPAVNTRKIGYLSCQ